MSRSAASSVGGEALEWAMVLEERYGVTIENGHTEGNARIFASIRRLPDFVRTQHGEPGGGKD